MLASAFGFDPDARNEGLALAGFFIAFLGVPILLNLAATILAIFFPITERRRRTIRRRLEARERRTAETSHV